MAQSKTYQDFSAGLNDTSDVAILLENEAAVLTNASVNDSGILEKARGYTKDHSAFPADTDSFMRMLVNFKRGTSVDVLLEAALDDGNTNSTYKVDLKQSSGSGSSSYIGYTVGTATFTNGSATVEGQSSPAWSSHLKAGDKIKPNATSAWYEVQSVTDADTLVLTATFAEATQTTAAYTARIILHKDFIPRATVFNNKAVVVNGSEKPMTWDNTTLSKITDTDCPTAKFVEAHKNRVFMASTSSNPSRVFWSAVNDEQTWDASSLEDVFPQDNGTIIAIKSFGDSLVILKNNGKIYQISGGFDQSAIGEPTFIRKVDVGDNIGIIAERTPVVHNDGFLYFVSQTGLYKVDQRMSVEKVTLGLETLFSGANFTLGPTSSKAYTYDSKTQWDTGTHDGTKAISVGNLQPYYDFYTISSDVLKSNGCAAVAIDSNKLLHVAYVKASGGADNSTNIVYKQIAVDGTVTTEVAKTHTGSDANFQIRGVSIDVSSDGKVGIAYSDFPNSNTSRANFVERTAAGTWGSILNITGASNSPQVGFWVSCKYGTDNNIRVATDCADSGKMFTWNGASWTASGSFSLPAGLGLTDPISLVLDSSNDPRVAVLDTNSGNIRALTGTGTAATWTLVESFSASLAASPIQLALNAAGNLITGYVASDGTFKIRNHTTAATTVLDSDTDLSYGSLAILSDQYYGSYQKTSSKHRLYFNGTKITESTGTADSAIYPGDRALTNSGKVFAMVRFGANANELLVRRIAFNSTWTSPEQSDSTLTAWGSYDIEDQTENGATVLHEVATATTSPASSYATITDGQTVSADSAKLVVRNRITFTLTDFAAPSVGSVVLNFTGSGVDAKQMAAISFNDDLLIAYAETAETANNKVLRMDKNGAFSILTWPLSVFERYRGRLFGGKSTNGDLLLLDNSYGHAGVAYSMEWRGKEDFLGSIEGLKNINKVYILYKVRATGTFTFSYRLDNFANANGSTFSDTTIDQTVNGMYELSIGQTARSIQFKITNGILDNQVGILGIVIVFVNQTIH